jgi:uncharacterized protein YbaR (Trm112 family)
MERFLEDDSQRPGKLIVDRPMVCGDIHNIPFVDNAFRFVSCSHILEHLDKPEAAIDELTRVAQQGYIETPSEIHEYLDLNFPFHRWAVSLEDGDLVFREKPHDIGTHPLSEAVRQKGNNTRRFLQNHHEDINILSVFWKRSVTYRVERCGRPIDAFPTGREPTVASEYVVEESRRKLKRLLGRVLSPRVDLYSILACPICKRRVKKGNNQVLTCEPCGKKYPILNDIPMMTPDHAEPL